MPASRGARIETRGSRRPRRKGLASAARWWCCGESRKRAWAPRRRYNASASRLFDGPCTPPAGSAAAASAVHAPGGCRWGGGARCGWARWGGPHPIAGPRQAGAAVAGAPGGAGGGSGPAGAGARACRCGGGASATVALPLALAASEQDPWGWWRWTPRPCCPLRWEAPWPRTCGPEPG